MLIPQVLAVLFILQWVHCGAYPDDQTPHLLVKDLSGMFSRLADRLLDCLVEMIVYCCKCYDRSENLKVCFNEVNKPKNVHKLTEIRFIFPRTGPFSALFSNFLVVG